MNDQSTENTGYLVVRVSTARGAIPLENATVSIRGYEKDDSGILYSVESDVSGLTPRLSLPAPPRSLSQTPNDSIPYSLWNIDVFKDGYITARYSGVPVYSGVTSIQSAELVPLTEGFEPSESFNESQPPNL